MSLFVPDGRISRFEQRNFTQKVIAIRSKIFRRKHDFARLRRLNAKMAVHKIVPIALFVMSNTYRVTFKK